ncbi:MAG: pantoate--beta-alanine ligase [Endozoicomonadaceae bacterium]|nr:pantoate--beta-alanine ligase [Endozoicomonadaceae bacterium]
MFKDHQTIQQFCKRYKQQGQSIAFVPTMGNLHEGHLALVAKAKQSADIVIVSLYVNPMQFGANEDFNTYPRTLESDISKLTTLAVEGIFLPSAEQIYPNGIDQHTSIHTTLDSLYCGKSRPQFFSGIATIVTYFFNLITPDMVLFGEKDFQQLCVVKKIVRDLVFPIEVIGVETSREPNGLACSSRNQYLTSENQESASALYRILIGLKKDLIAGQKSFTVLEKLGWNQLIECNFTPDYLNIVSQKTLQPPTSKDTSLIILVACLFKQVRLIDNIKVELLTS